MSAAGVGRRSTLRFAGRLVLGAMVGKALGFVREVLFAKHLGTTAAADSFRGATTAVLVPLVPLQGDLVTSTLVPLFRTWAAEGRASRMASSLCAAFAAAAAVLAVLVALSADAYTDLLLAGFGAEAKAETAAFTRVMALAMPASVLIACFGFVELGLGRSRMMAIRPSVQNISVLVGIGVMSWTGQVIAIAWAFSAGMILVALYGLITLWREGELSPLDARVGSAVEAVAEFFRRARPLLLLPLVEQGNVLLERLLASALAVGTLASLEYARTVTDTVYYAVSQPVGYVVLGQEQAADVGDRVRALCRPILHLSLPASAFVGLFAADITAVVFGRGAFRAEAIASTALALQGISVALWATTLGWILVRMLNAQQRNGAAARVVMCAYAANMIVAVATFRWLGPFGLGLAEAARGLLLLSCAAYALGCVGLLARLVMQAVPITLVLGGAGLVLRAEFDAPLPRLLAGAALFGAVLIPWLLLCVPETANRARALFPRRSGPGAFGSPALVPGRHRITRAAGAGRDAARAEAP